MAKYEEFLSEVCERCDDIGFKDFNKGKYFNALYRANRMIARKYHLFQKLYQFSPGESSTDLTADIHIDLPDMKEEILVSVNGVNLRKKDNQILDNKDMYCYYLFRTSEGNYLFNYAKGMVLEDDLIDTTVDISASTSNLAYTDRTDTGAAWGKSTADEISILYECIPERDYDQTEFIIPPNYEEEQVKHAVVHIAQLGIAKFKEEKLGKYSRLYKLYKVADNSIDPDVVESGEPIRIQLFQYP